MTELVRPLDLRAPGAIQQLLDWRRTLHGNLVMMADDDGGGGDDVDNGGGGDDKGNGDGDLGFPEKTPVDDMTADQKAAYYKHQNRRAETQRDANSALLKKLGVKDEAGVQALLDAKKAADKLAADKATDVEKAKAEGVAEERAKAAERNVRAAFKIAVAGRKTDDEVASYLEELNLTRFVDEDGEVDTAKVLERAKQFAPDTGKTDDTGRKGPRGKSGGAGGAGSGGRGSGGGSVRDIMAARAAERERAANKS